jgi:DNA-binding NtrC family response regulator
MELLCRAQREHPTLPCFVLTALDKAEPAVVALKAGAVDYFTKPFDQRRIFTSIQAVLRNPPSPRTAPPASSDPWKSEAMIAANRYALEAAASGVPILLIGNRGTGKRAFANFIHRRSSRAAMPFITVDASALDETSLELELFGGESRHASGSFVRKRGKIEMCQGGTLYIHEIEHLPLSLQARLCEALELRANDRGTGFRLIASSRSDLGGQFRRNLMRHDLFYRLSTAPIHLPSLCEATEDIPTWCERLLTEICIHHQRRRPQFTKGALEALVDFPWPGNLDQLRQTLEQVLMQSTRKLIGIEDLPAEVSSGGPSAPTETNALPQAARINDLEQAALIAALNTFNGNRRRTAKRLGVSLRTVYNMIDRYGLKNLNFGGSPA